MSCHIVSRHATPVIEQAHREPAGVVVRVDGLRGSRGMVALHVRLPLPARALFGGEPVRVRCRAKPKS